MAGEGAPKDQTTAVDVNANSAPSEGDRDIVNKLIDPQANDQANSNPQPK